MKILIAGDFCPQNRVAELFEKCDYASVLGEMKPIIEQADYSIVNFECSVIKGGEKPIMKQGRNLHCSEKGMEAIKWAGFDCVTLANNHFRDYGEEGICNTLKTISEYGLDSVGGGMNIQEAAKILYKEIDGKTLAIINCCEHEFSIATNTSAGSNPLNPIQQYYAINEARAKANYVLVIVHGGHEMWQLPSPRMVETYRFFIDVGADAVVNHHQHCYSGYEMYRGKPIFYGLGNFCFDKLGYYEGLWEYGYMVSIIFFNDIKMTIHPYTQCKQEPKNIQLKDRIQFDKEMQRLNTIIASPNSLQKMTDAYYTKQLQSTRMAFEPYRGHILSKLYLKGGLYSFLNKRKILKLRNMIETEAHRDKTLFFLTH